MLKSNISHANTEETKIPIPMKTKFIRSACALFGMALLTILAACEKDNGGGDNNNNNNNNPPAPTQKAFFNLDGQVFVGARSATLRFDAQGKDSQVLWRGKGGITDTTIYVNHIFPNFRTGFYTIDSVLAVEPGRVDIGASWGYELSSPQVEVTSGTYELKWENNRYVGYLTNGKGRNAKNGKRYNNITMKLIYPQQ